MPTFRKRQAQLTCVFYVDVVKHVAVEPFHFDQRGPPLIPLGWAESDICDGRSERAVDIPTYI